MKYYYHNENFLIIYGTRIYHILNVGSQFLNFPPTFMTLNACNGFERIQMLD